MGTDFPLLLPVRGRTVVNVSGPDSCLPIRVAAELVRLPAENARLLRLFGLTRRAVSGHTGAQR